jgi:hypothetical protein
VVHSSQVLACRRGLCRRLPVRRKGRLVLLRSLAKILHFSTVDPLHLHRTHSFTCLQAKMI